MQRSHAAAIALALAASSTAAVARSGDTWSGTNRHREYAPLEVIELQPGDRVVVHETQSWSTPVIVERGYTREPGTVYYHEPVYAYRQGADNDWVKDLNPQTGHRIGDGLFNREGPNDFGG